MEEKLKTTLIQAGWYEGRIIKSEIEDTLVYPILPTKVQDFFSEFGGLTLHAENEIETMIVTTYFFNNQNAFDYYSLNKYKIQDEINFTEENDLDYYYSTLIGLQLYEVAKLIEQATVLMDEHGNFYIINFLPELVWISNNTSDALIKILFGTRDAAIFNEHTMKWMAPVGKELQHILPVNPMLKENPW